MDVDKSPTDKKAYRWLELANGARALLVHDPDILAGEPAKLVTKVKPSHEDEGSDELDSADGMMDEDATSKSAPAKIKKGGGGRGAKTAVKAMDAAGKKRKPEVQQAGKKNPKKQNKGAEEMSEDDSEDDDSEGDSEDGSGSDDDDSDDDDSEGDEGESMSEDESGSSQEGEEDGSESGKGARKSKGQRQAVKKAAAAMAVGVGSLSDPAHMQGLSHYLEHMLFMGSDKFPSENEYDEYLQAHGGTSNAYTELEHTNYHFECAPDALHGALDRFAQFFLCPLFLEGALEREVCAVDSEFAGVQQTDGCRASQLMCYTARPGHKYRQFSWGNKKSLWDLPRAAGTDVRQEIISYYKAQYSAERMSLVVLGGETLDELQAWVETMFAALPTGRGARPSFADIGPPFQGRQLYVMPAVRDVHDVTITFQLPCMTPHYKKKADNYVSHLVGHEGPGSLLSHLKAKEWATEVCAGVEEDGYSLNSGLYLFSITMTLTDAGLAAGEGCGLAAVGAAFQYLAMLRAAGPQEWVWREMATLADMKFRFQEDEDAMDMVTRVAAVMHLFPPKHVLSAEYVHEQWDPKLVESVLSAMDPTESEYRVDVSSHLYSELRQRVQTLAEGAATTDTEPWFNMEATWAPLPTTLCASWATTAPPPEMRLPPPNPYVPTDFSVVAHAEGKKEVVQAQDAAAKADLAAKHSLPMVLATPPVMILEEPGLRVWHKLDRAFSTPRANLYMRLSSPDWCDSPRTAALCHLMLKLVEDALCEDSYLADVAGLHYGTVPEGWSGLELKVDGFSHKLPLLAARLLSTLRAADFTASSFSNVKEALLRKYRNTGMQVPKHANYQRLYALCARAWHWTALQPHIESACLDDIAPFITRALASCHLEVLAHGNIDRAHAVALAVQAQGVLGPGCAASATARARDQCVVLPLACQLLHTLPARNLEEENCCVEAYFQVGPAGDARSRAMIDLIDQLVQEPAYNSLRTQQQLGYTVHTGSRLTHGVLGFCFVVVSASHTPAYVETCIERFLVTYSEDKLAAMGVEELSQQKAALAANKLQRDRALGDEGARHWDHIWNEKYDFLAREVEVAALEAITPDDVRAWWAEYLSVASPQRRKLSVHIVPVKPCLANGQNSQQAAPADGKAAGAGGGENKVKATTEVAGPQPQLQLIPDLDDYKHSLQQYPWKAAVLPSVESA